MQDSKVYKKRSDKINSKNQFLLKKRNFQTILRVLLFFGGITGFYFIFSQSVIIAFVFLIFISGAFIVTILSDNKLKKKLEFNNILKKINNSEICVLNHKFDHLIDGSEFISKDHPFSNDLDIFGKTSLFQYLNRSESFYGINILANWLNSPSKIKETEKRQEAVQELTPQLDWRQELHAHLQMTSPDNDRHQTILNWLGNEPVFGRTKRIRTFLVVLPVLSLTALALHFWFLPIGYFVAILTLNFWVSFTNYKKVTIIHQKVAKTVDFFTSFSKVLHHIEFQSFNSEFLKELQEKIKPSGIAASRRITRLSDILSKLDYRLNILVAIPLNLLFLWDLQYITKLENWKSKNKGHVENWFKAIGEFEALAGIANMAYNNPQWTYPESTDLHFSFIAHDIGHPLIPEERRVTNDFKLTGTSKIGIITGSNMSGKTTFLRTIGVNHVLAMLGSPVCAKKLIFLPSAIRTSMRISDSLSENTSSFYAELKRLKSILEAVKQGERSILLLDEILRGTNSKDRHLGSRALIAQLLKQNATGLLATHDLNLSELESKYPQQIDNYNFDVQIEGEELYFDYKIHDGVCKSLNASILMKKMGIDLS